MTWSTVGKSRQDIERAGTEMQNVQMVQWRWELEVPFATATTMRGEETVLIRTSFHPFIPSVFQPSYIVL